MTEKLLIAIVVLAIVVLAILMMMATKTGRYDGAIYPTAIACAACIGLGLTARGGAR